jgi:hypothetical protein
MEKNILKKMMTKRFYAFIVVSMLFVCMVNAQFVHPGITHTQADLERMKDMVQAEIDPWYTTYNNMKEDKYASYDYVVLGNDSITSIESHYDFMYDGYAAYYNALMWYITGDERHAEKSVEIFNAWVNLTHIEDQFALNNGRGPWRMCEAAEIIKYTYDGWADEDIEKFKAMLVYPGWSGTEAPTEAIASQDVTFYWNIYQGDRARHGNQGLFAYRSMMAMAIFLDNEIMYDRALRYLEGLSHRSDDLAYPSGPPVTELATTGNEYYEEYTISEFDDSVEDYGYNEVMSNYIYENGQCQESSRDQAHALVGVVIIGCLCEMAWNQGDDLYGYLDNRLLLGLEFYFHYNLSWENTYYDQLTSWEPTVENGEYIECFDRSGRWKALKVNPYTGAGLEEDDWTRGNYNTKPVYEISLAHYRDRMQLDSTEYKWLQRGFNLLTEEIGVEDGDGPGDHPGYGGLKFRRVSPGDPISGFDDDGLPVYAMNELPMTIEAENFDYFAVSGEGHTYRDSTSGNSGNQYRTDEDVDIDVSSAGEYYVGDIYSDEYLTYTVNVPGDGEYSILVNYVGLDPDGTLSVYFDDVDKTGVVSLPETGDEESWTDLTVAEGISLTKGVKSMKILAVSSDSSFYLNNITISLDAKVDQSITFSDLASVEEANDDDVCLSAISSSGLDVTFSSSDTSVAIVSGNYLQPVGAGTVIITASQIGNDVYNAAPDVTQELQVVSEGSSVMVEAEEYYSMSGVATESTTDVDGGLDVGYIGSGDWMEYKVEIPSTGSYIIEYRYASWTEGCYFTTSIDDVDVETVDLDLTNGTQTWSSIYSESLMYLTAGIKTILITSGSSGWNLNWFRIYPKTDGGCTCTSCIEAENYTDMSGISIVETSDTTGAFHVESLDSADWMEYEFTLSLTMNYTVGYRLASATTGSYTLTLDDEVFDTFTYAATGSEDTWETQSSETSYALSAGLHTLKVSANNSGSLLNWINFVEDESVCDATMLEPSYIITTPEGVIMDTVQSNEVAILPGYDLELFGNLLDGGAWNWSGPDEFSSTAVTVELSSIQVDQGGEYVVNFTNDCGTVISDTFTVSVLDSVYIEAEDYNEMFGVDTATTTDVFVSEYLNSIDVDDWMEYEVNVPFSGNYLIDYRVSSATESGEFELSLNGTKLEDVIFNATGDEDTWSTVSSSAAIYLDAGTQTLKITAQSDGWNINWLQLNLDNLIIPCNLPFTTDSVIISNGESVWSSGIFDISCADQVNLYMNLQGSGALEESDYLNIYYEIDDSSEVLISENTDSVSQEFVSITGIEGSTIEIIIEGSTSSLDVEYKVSDIRISVPPEFDRLEAEDYSAMSGIFSESTSDEDGDESIWSVNNGDWLMFSDLDIIGAISFQARLATSIDGAYIEVRLDSLDGTLIGNLEVEETEGFSDWETRSAILTETLGVHDIYFVFVGDDDDYLFNINWFMFSEEFVKGQTDPYERFEAEYTDGQSGVSSTTTTDVDGGEEVNDIEGGDYIMFSDLDLEAADSLYARVASDTVGGVIEVRLGSTTGDIIAFIDVPNTGSASNWETVSAAVNDVVGVYDIYFVFRGDDSDLFRLNWLQFTSYENSFAKLESEDYDTISASFDTDDSTDDEDEDGQILKYITSGNWLKFADVNLTGAKSVDARYATGFSDSYIEVRMGDSDGELIGTIELESTGGLTKWETASAGISDQSDTCDVYFVYQAESSSSVFCSNWFQFSDLDIDETIDPSSRIEAEDYNRASGTVTSTTTDVDGEEELDSIEYGDWILFKNVDLTDLKSIDVRVASLNDNSRIEFRTGSYGGSLLTNVSISNTGSTSIWETASADLYSEMEGEYDVYLVFKGSTSSDDLLNINWLQFNSTSTGIAEPNFSTDEIQLFPNPVADDVTITGALGAKVLLYNIPGNLISITSIESDEQIITMNDLSSGYYLLKVIKSDGTIESFKVMKR